MKRLTRKRALEVAHNNEIPGEYMQKPQHVLLLTCISCIGEGVVYFSNVRDMQAEDEVHSDCGDVEWYKTPIGYVCGACATSIEKDDDEEEE